MRTSISRRLFITIIAVVLGISILILLANTLLLKPLYYSSIKSTMIRAMDKLSEMDYADTSTLAEQIQEITAGSAYSVVIRSADAILYSDSRELGLMPQPAGNDAAGTAGGNGSESGGPVESDGVDENGEAQTNTGSQPQPENDNSGFPDSEDRFNFGLAPETKDWDRIDDRTNMGVAIEPRSHISMLFCIRHLGDGVSIILAQAVEPVNQSIMQANILLIACAIITLGLSAVFVFKLSRRFTEPIRRIKVKVGEIAALDFGEPCQIKTGDELESLGNDVNLLGEKLKTTLETLRLQNEQLEKDIIAQRQFISNASHELRTPLSLIKGYADEMTAGYAPNASQKDLYISIIAEEAAKMNRLLKEMLELSRMESGHVTMQTDVFFVRERIQAFLDKYDGYIAENGLHIRVIEGKEMQGVFDPMYFEQILANYISNAGRYGDSDKRIEISVQDRGDSVRVTVFNTGEPIDEEIIEHIWDGFYKADRARTRVKDSYGLGLSIVKAIQTSAGQGYGVQNVPGGVEFWFDVKRAIHTASKE